jgi:hypothetical protein
MTYSNSTLTLMPILNLLVHPDRVQPWLRAPIIQALARLPLRPRGVQDTIEFVFSIHPSNANRQETVGSRSSNISHEALSSASRLLSSPPQSMSPEEWFNGIGPQLLELLDGRGEREMDKAAAYIIGFGILGRKMYGAPGMNFTSVATRSTNSSRCTWMEGIGGAHFGFNRPKPRTQNN